MDDILIDGVLAELREELPLFFAQAAAGTIGHHPGENLLVILGFQLHDAAAMQQRGLVVGVGVGLLRLAGNFGVVQHLPALVDIGQGVRLAFRRDPAGVDIIQRLDRIRCGLVRADPRAIRRYGDVGEALVAGIFPYGAGAARPSVAPALRGWGACLPCAAIAAYAGIVRDVSLATKALHSIPHCLHFDKRSRRWYNTDA